MSSKNLHYDLRLPYRIRKRKGVSQNYFLGVVSESFNISIFQHLVSVPGTEAKQTKKRLGNRRLPIPKRFL